MTFTVYKKHICIYEYIKHCKNVQSPFNPLLVTSVASVEVSIIADLMSVYISVIKTLPLIKIS